MTVTGDEARLYHLSRPDGLGFFRRRSGRQFAIATGGVALALVGVKASGAPGGVRAALALVGVVVLVVAAARTPSGENVVDLLAPTTRFLRDRAARRDRWAAPLAPTGANGSETPPLFGGLALFDFDPATGLGRTGRHVGIVHDRGDGTVSLALRVSGEGFLVADAGDQDARLDGWGRALAEFCRDGHPVVRVSWSQWRAPAGIEVHRAWLSSSSRSDPDEAMVAAYDELLATAGEAAARSEVLVVLSVAAGRVKVLASHHGDRQLAAVDRLLDESDLFAGLLQRSGLVVSRPLAAAGIADALRERLDPSCVRGIEVRARSLGELAGVTSPSNALPLAVEETRGAIRTDGSVHRVFRVAEWPRTPLRADWLAAFLCDSASVRSFTVHFLPQSRRAARREASLLATRAASAVEDKESHRRRVGADERRAQNAAEALDTELESGAGLERFVGLVVVTAPDLDELDSACEATIQLAGNCGIDLRRLELRQGAALVAALPIGRGVVSAR